MEFKIIECPRDAMQGLSYFVPTELKIRYLNSLLACGFDTLDFGSFVSPKAIPQMRDTAEVLDHLVISDTKLLAIVANTRGAEDACRFDRIHYLGFPLSVSETFQLRNTNKTIAQALEEVWQIQDLCSKHNKSMVVYLSMGFGNPYGDPYHPDLILEFITELTGRGINIVSLADTIGSSTPERITDLFSKIIPAFPVVEIGAHLHSQSYSAHGKIKAVFNSGCRRIDGALLGYGGCPMAKDDLVGNIDTLQILQILANDYSHKINVTELEKAKMIAQEVFVTSGISH